MEIVQEFLNQLAHSISELKRQLTQKNITDTVWLMGIKYDPPLSDEFSNQFVSIPRFTYRSGQLSDVGWGCMLRCGQSIMASGLLRSGIAYHQVMPKFIEDPDAELSIHRIMKSAERMDVKVGQWFGPATIANSLKPLVTDIEVVVFTDGTLYLDQLSGKSNFLLLVPVRLGLDKVPSQYHQDIQRLFQDRNCLGIAGGQPNSAYYFVGSFADQLIYLDPHEVQPPLTSDDYSSCHNQKFKSMPISQLDPSMLIGFYVRDLDQFVAKYNQFKLFGIQQKQPSVVEDFDEF